MPARVEFLMCPDEVEDFVRFIKRGGEYRFLPQRLESAELAEYAHPDQVPRIPALKYRPSRAHSGSCYMWDRRRSPRPVTRPSRVGDFFLDNPDAIYLLRNFDEASGLVSGYLEIGDLLTMPDGSLEALPEQTVANFNEMSRLIKGGSRYVAELRRHVSLAALRRLATTEAPPTWVRDALERGRRKPARGAGGRRRRRSYQDSFAFVNEAAGLDGKPKPRVRRRPRYDDENPGPTFFRTAIAEQVFEALTLPGLYVGRSELVNVSFAGSNLRLSTLNWSDFRDCDFSRCDLSKSDLRGCEFEGCKFVDADLSATDLRYSSFKGCDFTGAKVDEATFHHDQRREVALADEQAGRINWTDDLGEPEDG